MTFSEQRAALIQYLRHKVEIADWHAVRDCAVDIELLEAKERGRELALKHLTGCACDACRSKVM